jgi:hypothetical protein
MRIIDPFKAARCIAVSSRVSMELLPESCIKINEMFE